ncbi:type IV secretory system conjugative DNA transfer family protein [Desulfovibrio sp. TomC]|uniref:type IV secretory system conjugative DNA transfer family protein n=1 Tax=Desulfovibrio sp. TomC TaxID=1562888 RepID=UPI0005747AD3|nr:type IV secretory system conjugative DNA transfer family protein [Desulfovibrio sp. TomC]KHK00342.1 Type IV secretion system protein VirD4 [Desulfovibrio sp. TomC]
MPADRTYGLGKARRQRRSRWPYLVFVAVLATVAMSVATQRVAFLYGFQPALGTPLVRAFEVSWYLPWKIFDWQEHIADRHGHIQKSLAIAQAVFILPQLLVFGLWLGRLRLSEGRDDLHGSARWADETDIQSMGLFGGQGVYVGGWIKAFRGLPALGRSLVGKPASVQLYLRHSGPEHILCFAPTRSGKGVGLILPTLLSWSDSTVVFDIKGENWSLTAGYRKSIGHTVLKFDPSDATGASACFNPLEEIRLETIHAIPDAQNLVGMILDPQGKGLADYWNKAAFAFLGGTLLHALVMVRHKEQRTATLFDLSRTLADAHRGVRELFQEMLDTDHAALLDTIFPDGHQGQDLHAFIASAAREILNKADNELSGVVSTAVANLALYRDPVVARNIGHSDFRLADLMHHEKPVSLYLVISPADIDRLRPLIRIVVNLLLSRGTARMDFGEKSEGVAPKHRLLLLLDEFTALGRLDSIERAIAYMAGYGIKGYFIVQDIVQLSAVYGKDNGLMANCHIRVAYAPNTIETAQVLSAMTGKTTVVEKRTSLSGSRSGSLKNASVSVSETARPLLTEDECMRLPGPQKDAAGKVVAPGDMLLFCAGRPPIYGRQILYFLDPVFSRRAGIKPPQLSDSLNREIAMPPVDKPEHDTAAAEPDKDKGYESYLERM